MNCLAMCKMRGRSAFGPMLLVTLALSTLFAVAAAGAADAQKAAQAVAAEAIRSYEAGQHGRAAELYLQAYRLDPSSSGYLYSAARAMHVGGELEEAERHYKKFLATPGVDAGRAAKVSGYLRDVDQDIQKRLVREAEAADRAGDSVLAYARWKAVTVRNPAQLEAWLRAGEAARRAGRLGEAAEAYRSYLAAAPPDAEGRMVAEARLAELGDKGPAASSATRRVGQSGHASSKEGEPSGHLTKSGTPSRTGAYIVGGLGLAGAGLGAALLAAGASAAAAADRMPIRSATDVDAYDRDWQAAQSTWQVGAVATGAGVAAIGVAAWLLLRERPQRAEVSFDPVGRQLWLVWAY